MCVRMHVKMFRGGQENNLVSSAWRYRKRSPHHYYHDYLVCIDTILHSLACVMFYAVAVLVRSKHNAVTTAKPAHLCTHKSAGRRNMGVKLGILMMLNSGL